MTAELPLVHRSRPPATDADGPPGVVLLHGRGADETDLLGLAEALPDSLHVLSVRAPDRLGPGYTWYELDVEEDLHESQPDPEDFARSQATLDRFVEGAREAYGLDGVGLFGFSQGAVLAMAAIIDEPSYRWAVALHGYLPGDCEPTDDERPVFLGAGEADSIIPPERVEGAADRLRAAGFAVRAETYPTGHGIGPGERADAAEWVAARL